MRLPDLESTKKFKVIILLFLIYITGVVIYFFLGSYDKNISYVPDERLYVQAAKAFANGDGLYYNGLKSTFQKIIYSIIISPAYLVKDLHLQIKLVCLIGTLFEMTSVFPVYLISRKLNLSKTKSLLMSVFSISFPIFLFSMSFMSETAYLPLWIWVFYIVLTMLDSDEISIVSAIILGVLGYVLYMCKEVGVVAIPALFVAKAITIFKKKGDFKGILPCIISGAVFGAMFLLSKFLLFNGSGSSYNYQVVAPEISDTKGKNPVSFFLYAFVFYLGYIILVNYIFPVFIRNHGDELNKKFTMYIEIAFLTLLFAVVYRIALKEDFGLMSPRLHLRYFEPLFIPYYICFVARLENMKEEDMLDHKYIKLSFGIFLAVLMMLPGLNYGEILDSTTLMTYLIPEKIAYAFFLGSPQKTVIMTILMKIIILAITLLEVKIMKKNKKIFMYVFLSIAFTINIVGGCIKYRDIRNDYELPEHFVTEMQEINDMLGSLSGKKLIIEKQNIRLSEILVTYYDINDTDLYLAGDDFDYTDDVVVLKAANSSREAKLEDYDYIVYGTCLWEESEMESIPSEKIILTTKNYFILDNK